MGRKIVAVLLVLFGIFLVIPQGSEAGSFSMIADSGKLNLRDNVAWEKSYKMTEGEIKIRFRKLVTSDKERQYHLIVWWNNERISHGYCPDIPGGYSFKIFRNNDTQRIYIVFLTQSRDVMFGYDPVGNKLEKYVDSDNYESQWRNPNMKISPDGDLLLSFAAPKNMEPIQYQFFWDEAANWFGYKDVTVRKPAPTPTPAPVYVEEPRYYPPAAPEYSYEELYYEEEVVVGS